MKKQPIRVNERIFEKHVFDRFGIRVFKRESIQMGGNFDGKMKIEGITFPDNLDLVESITQSPPWLRVFQSYRKYGFQFESGSGFRIVRNKT